jgi:hypothetical protein
MNPNRPLWSPSPKSGRDANNSAGQASSASERTQQDLSALTYYGKAPIATVCQCCGEVKCKITAKIRENGQEIAVMTIDLLKKNGQRLAIIQIWLEMLNIDSPALVVTQLLRVFDGQLVLDLETLTKPSFTVVLFRRKGVLSEPLS